MPEYVVIFRPGPIFGPVSSAQIGKKVTTKPRDGSDPITYYKPVLTGTLRDVSATVEKLNAAVADRPGVTIENTP